MTASLDELRRRIDAIDEELVRVLNERAAITHEVGKLKAASNGPVYIPGREEEVYRRVCSLNNGPLRDETLRAIYREVISGCRRTQFDLRVCFLGPEATFTEFAAREKFGASMNYYPARSISRVFVEVDRNEADYGVVPVENSTEGSVSDTLDMLMEFDTKISAEILMPIHHALLAHRALEDVRVVYSKPEALAQCRAWLTLHLPEAELRPVASTAEAAIIARKEDNAAAIAHKMAGSVYGLTVLHSSIEDLARNTTRFLVLGGEIGSATGNDKTSVVFTIHHRSGALYDALTPFKQAGVNLANLMPRPSRKHPWEYCFFVDLFGHRDDANVAAALDELRKLALTVRVLGSYPAAGMPQEDQQ